MTREIRTLLPQNFHSRLPVVRKQRFKAEPVEDTPDGLPNVILIIDNQNGSGPLLQPGGTLRVHGAARGGSGRNQNIKR